MRERRHEAEYERRETGDDPLQGKGGGLGQGDLFNNFLFESFKLF